MAHCVVREAEEILDREFPVLNKGFIRMVDYMGGDERIVQAARVSYGKGSKTYRKDRGLINYLLRNDHTSPFEQVVFTFHVKLPIFVARQWVRHRTARLNEISGRYSVMQSEFYLPDEQDIAFQSVDNKQGRAPDRLGAALRKKVLDLLSRDQDFVYADYQTMLDDNIARELARINLPLSLYTEWYWQIDLHNLFHFLRLRLDSHAQKEIRAYAEVMFDIVSKVCPIAAEAFEEHVLHGKRLSRAEMNAVRSLLRGETADLDARSRQLLAGKLGFDPLSDTSAHS
jgi:thymidylate synthase (FAD)